MGTLTYNRFSLHPLHLFFAAYYVRFRNNFMKNFVTMCYLYHIIINNNPNSSLYFTDVDCLIQSTVLHMCTVSSSSELRYHPHNIMVFSLF